MRQKVSGSWRGPGVIVSKEKHSTFYYDATNEETFLLSAVAVLKGRRDGDFYRDYPQNNPPPDLSMEAAETLPKGSAMRLLWEGQKGRYQRGLERAERAAEFLRKVNRAIRETDGETAWALLKSRDDYEYEGIEYVRFSK